MRSDIKNHQMAHDREKVENQHGSKLIEGAIYILSYRWMYLLFSFVFLFAGGMLLLGTRERRVCGRADAAADHAPFNWQPQQQLKPRQRGSRLLVRAQPVGSWSDSEGTRSIPLFLNSQREAGPQPRISPLPDPKFSKSYNNIFQWIRPIPKIVPQQVAIILPPPRPGKY